MYCQNHRTIDVYIFECKLYKPDLLKSRS